MMDLEERLADLRRTLARWDIARGTKKQKNLATSADVALLKTSPVLTLRLKIWQEVLDTTNGAHLSLSDQHDLGTTDPYKGDASLTYGDVTFCSFIRLLRDAVLLGSVPRDGTAIFADLGCGSGKALLAAALCPRCGLVGADVDHMEPMFSRCVGIEILPSLAGAASAAANTLQELVSGDYQSYSNNSTNTGMLSTSLVQTVCADVLDVDWSFCDVVYVASLCMSHMLLQGILERASSLKTGSILIALEGGASQLFRELDSTHGWLLHNVSGPFHFSWGLATAQVLVKKDVAIMAVVGPGLGDLD